MAKTSSRKAPAKATSWSPESKAGWTLPDGLGLTMLIALVFAWTGTGDGSAVTALILTVGSLACLPYGLARLRASQAPRLVLIPLGAGAALLVWGVVSAVGSGAPWQVSLYGWFGRSDGLLTLLAVLALLASAAALTRTEVDRVVTWLLVAGAIAVLEALGQLAGLPYPPRPAYDGVSAALGNPNFFAAVSAMLAVLSIGRAISAGRPAWQRLAALALAAGLAASSFLSQSVQGPVALGIGLVAGGIAWSLQHRGKGRVLALSLSALVIVGGLVGLVLVALKVGPFSAVRGARTIGFRESYWEAAWRMMTGRPVFGSGPDSFSRYVAEFRTETYLQAPGSQIRVSAAHDIPLQYGATFGVIGLLAWLVLMVSVGVLLVRALLRGVDQVWLVVSLAGAWVAYLAQAMISIDAPGLKALGWLVTGLVVALAVNRSPAQGPGPSWRPWAAGALGLLALVVWLPSITTTSSAAGAATVQEATASVTNPLVPCPLRQQTLSGLAQAVPLQELAPLAIEALDVDPRCAAMAILVSEIALQAGDLEEARKAADIAVATDPLAPGSWFILSLVLAQSGDQTGADAALAEAKRLAAIDPSDTLDQALAMDPSAQPSSP